MIRDGYEDNVHGPEGSAASLSTLRYQQMMRRKSPTPTRVERIVQLEPVVYDGQRSSHISATPVSQGIRTPTMSSAGLQFKSAPEPIHNVILQVDVNLAELWQSFIRNENQESFDEHGALLFSGLPMKGVADAESIEDAAKVVVGKWMGKWHPSAEIEWHSLGTLVKGKGKA